MMITSYLGMELFRKGICAYLEKHKYIFFQKKIFWFFLLTSYMSKGICARDLRDPRGLG